MHGDKAVALGQAAGKFRESDRSWPKDCERALVVDARSEENNEDHSSKCKGAVYSKKDLAEPTRLEITGKPTSGGIARRKNFQCIIPATWLEQVRLGPDENSKSLDSRMLRAGDALQHIRAEEWDGVRVAGVHGLQ